MKWDSLVSKVSWWGEAEWGEMSPCRCQSFKKKVLGGQRGSDGYDQQPVQADRHARRRGSQDGGVEVPAFRHRHCSSWSSSPRLFILSCPLLFQVTKGLWDHQDLKVCCSYRCSDITRACLTPGNPNVTHAPVFKSTDDSGSWTLGLGGMCLSDRETEAQRGATKYQHCNTVVG